MSRSCGARRLIDASCFAADANAAPHYVAIDHDDEEYKYYLGELLLCFELKHAGQTHQCCLVMYLWPDYNQAHDDEIPLYVAADGKSLYTRYVDRRWSWEEPTYAVVSVHTVHFRAPLVTPPPPPTARTGAYLVLNDDVYGNY